MHEIKNKPGESASPEPEFSLKESILWEHCCGYWLLPEHLKRLRGSAAFFSRRYDEKYLKDRLDEITRGLKPRPHVIHVEVDCEGAVKLSTEPSSEDRSPVRARLAKQCIDAGNVFLYHNTTHRQVYDEAAAGMSGVDEVLLWNDRGEVTESCTANVVVELYGRYITPPVSCGLLPGVYRASLLQEGRYIERPITIDQLQDCTKLYLINSVIGWREVSNTAELVPH